MAGLCSGRGGSLSAEVPTAARSASVTVPLSGGVNVVLEGLHPASVRGWEGPAARTTCEGWAGGAARTTRGGRAGGAARTTHGGRAVEAARTTRGGWAGRGHKDHA